MVLIHVALAFWFVAGLLVLAAGLGAMWALGASLFAAGSRWLGVSLILFLTMIPLVPLIFLPRGKRFDAALRRRSRRGG